MARLDAQTLQAFVRRPLETASVDGIQFWINPASFRMTTERVQTEVPTRTGMARFSYGSRNAVYELEGTTGIGGLPELQKLERIRPWPGRKDRLITFTYPARFGPHITRFVYCSSFEDYIDAATAHLYFFYRLTLQDYPRTALPTQQPDTLPATLLLPPSG